MPGVCWLYFQGLISNRGIFSLRQVRTYFQGLLERELIRRYPDWTARFPEIPPDPSIITFRQFLRVTGVDLVVFGTNASQHTSLPFSAGATPDFPVVEAVMLSMCIPGVFRPLYVDTVVHSDPQDLRIADINALYKGLWVDGGVLNNYPRHCFNYVRVVEGLAYRDDPRHIPVAMPWRLFDLRTTDLRPPEDQVLGFTLSGSPNRAAEVPYPFSKYDPYSFFRLAAGIFEALLKPSTQGQILGYEDELMTIVLDPSKINVIDFAGPEVDEKRGDHARAEMKRAATRGAFYTTFTRLGRNP